MRHVVSLLI